MSALILRDRDVELHVNGYPKSEQFFRAVVAISMEGPMSVRTWMRPDEARALAAALNAAADVADPGLQVAA